MNNIKTGDKNMRKFKKNDRVVLVDTGPFDGYLATVIQKLDVKYSGAGDGIRFDDGGVACMGTSKRDCYLVRFDETIILTHRGRQAFEEFMVFCDSSLEKYQD